MALKIWLDGKLVDEQDAKISVFDHGLLYGDGVFEGIRVYDRRIFELQAHIERFFNSAKGIRLEIPMSKARLIKAMQETVEANDVIDGYIRLVVTRGTGTLGLNPFENSHAIVDPTTPERVARDASRTQECGMVQLCTVVDA